MTSQPVSRDDFEALAQAARLLAGEQLAAGAEVMPAMLLLGSLAATDVSLAEVPIPFPARTLGDLRGASLVCVPLGFLMVAERQPRGKRIITHLLRDFADRPEVRVLAFMHEAWVSTKRDSPPAEDPERTEALSITLMSADCQALMICPLEPRDAGKRILLEGALVFDTEGLSHSRFMRPPRTKLN